MNRRYLVLLGTLAAAPVLSASAAQATVPDFSGVWWHPSLPGFEPMSSGPTSVVNKSRRNGVSNYDQLVGDYSNPILQPWASDVVKKGELSLAGVTYPSPANQCWPEPVPFIYKNFASIILQKPDHITILYEQDHEFRYVRMSAQHPKNVKPSWHGDSVGHYEGDTLVVDTVGQKSGPFAMVDLYGTPYTKDLHVIERYRLIDYEDAKDGLDRDTKENQHGGNDNINRNYRGKHLQVTFTVEDKGAFTTPWTATITYGRGSSNWPETVCAENTHEYYNNKDSDVPTAKRPDF